MTKQQPGSWLLGKMNSPGGAPSHYTDEVYGTVQNTSPLTIWISQDLIVSGSFLELTTEAKGLTLPITLGVNGRDAEGRYVSGTASGSVTVFKPLSVGDRVRMIRVQQGQRFIVLGRA